MANVGRGTIGILKEKLQDILPNKNGKQENFQNFSTQWLGMDAQGGSACAA